MTFVGCYHSIQYSKNTLEKLKNPLQQESLANYIMKASRGEYKLVTIRNPWQINKYTNSLGKSKGAEKDAFLKR